MSRFDQRRRHRLQDPDVMAGFREMDGELSLLRAIDLMREQLHISKEQMARRMHRARPAVSRVLAGEGANPTLDTITDMLDALDLTADITLRPRSSADAGPLRVVTVAHE